MTRILRLLLIAAIALPLWQPVAATEITVCNGGNSNEYVPLFGFWADTRGVESQVIYPASYFTSNEQNVKEKEIKSITFYAPEGVPQELVDHEVEGENGVLETVKGATVTVRMGEVYVSNFTDETTGASEMASNRNKMDVVFSGQVTIAQDGKSMTITLSEPYLYQGNNLIIDMYIDTPADDADHSYWIGSNQTAITGWNSRYGAQRFLPKMTVVYDAVDTDRILNFSANVGATDSKDIPAGTVVVPDNLPSVFTVSEGNVTFTPKEAASYHGTITIDGEIYTLIGVGKKEGAPNATRDKNFFKAITYTWQKWDATANNGQGGFVGTVYTSNLSEIATDPAQIIEMLKKVYTERSIPGTYYRNGARRSYGSGTGSASATNDPYNRVLYTAVGTITRSGNTYSYNDAYGWNIGNNSSIETGTNNRHFKIDEFQPDAEGMTLLLLELVDGFKPKQTYTTQNGYADLWNYIDMAIKSARVITEAKRSGEGEDAGTLFKIDCDKMTDFFFLGKGQLLGFTDNGDYDYPNYNTSGWNQGYRDYCIQTYMDTEPPLFCHMFEQFSPSTNDEEAITDIYDKLTGKQDFPVKHDCPNVVYVSGKGHGFRMYESGHSSVDSHDVRDMMFFVPDYRMMYHSDRSGGNNGGGDYYAYHESHRPNMAMFVIVQDPIQGKKVTTGEDTYELKLTWDSNLDEFLPSDKQIYELYQVEINEQGVETYKPVYYRNKNGQYTDANGTVVTTPVQIVLPVYTALTDSAARRTYEPIYIPMQETSQEVSFAIRGCDESKFLDFKMSNTRSFIIPGLDQNELMTLSDASHYSRFNPQTVKNCYSNMIKLKNNAIGINNNNITSSTALNIVRSHTETVGEDPVNETIATITFDKDSKQVTVTMANQSLKKEYPNSSDGIGKAAGYHYNNAKWNTNGTYSGVEGNGSWTQTYKVKGNNSDAPGNIDLDPALIIYDNFVVDVSENKHPNNYTYQLTSNYQSSEIYLKTINGTTDYTYGNDPSLLAESDWYAYTWNDSGNTWLKGEKVSKGQYKFNGLAKNANVIFVRIDPNVTSPSFDGNWGQTGNLEVKGNTFTLNGWLSGSWSDAYAHSNFFRVPVYKTETESSNHYSRELIDDDDEGTLGDDDPKNVEITQQVQYSSKTNGIYRYDIYRWGEKDPRFILEEITAVKNKDNEEVDEEPTGIADNQNTSYTVSMDGVNQNTYPITEGQTRNVTYIDYTPGNATVGTAYTYAPVIELSPSGYDSYDNKREDYNTYGGSLQNYAIGKFEVENALPNDNDPNNNALMSDYKWTGADGNYYSYYNVRLHVKTKSIPADYKIYRVRAWREFVDTSILGEEYPEFAYRSVPKYMFEDFTIEDDDDMTAFNSGYELGSHLGEPVTVTAADEESQSITYTLGTFGARRVRTSDVASDAEDYDKYYNKPFTVGLFARIYFTRAANLKDIDPHQVEGAPVHLLADGDEIEVNPIVDAGYADGKYYVVEAQVEKVIEPGKIPTGLVQNLNTREVVGVKYYNTLGIESDRPFDGVNIVVTRYSDGSTTTTKILK